LRAWPAPRKTPAVGRLVALVGGEGLDEGVAAPLALLVLVVVGDERAAHVEALALLGVLERQGGFVERFDVDEVGALLPLVVLVEVALVDGDAAGDDERLGGGGLGVGDEVAEELDLVLAVAQERLVLLVGADLEVVGVEDADVLGDHVDVLAIVAALVLVVAVLQAAGDEDGVAGLDERDELLGALAEELDVAV